MRLESCPVQALIFAYDPPRRELLERFDHLKKISLRALIEVDGEPAIGRLVKSIKSIPRVIISIYTSDVSGMREVFPEPEIEIRELKKVSAGKVVKILDGISPHHQILLIKGDLPFVETGELLELLDCSRREGAITFPIVGADLFPRGIRKHTASFRDGVFSPGRAFAGENRLLRSNSLLKKIEDYSESPLKVLDILGPGLLFKLTMGKATLNEVEKTVSGRLDIPIKFLRMSSDALARNLSNAEDLKNIKK